MNVQLPQRNKPRHAFLRARVPEGWRVAGASIGEKTLAVDDRGTVDLSDQSGEVTVVFSITRQ